MYSVLVSLGLKMGCCFSKELGPGRLGERTSLLQASIPDGLAVRDRDREHAVGVVQHVCVIEKDTCLPDTPAQQKSPEERGSQPALMVPNSVQTDPVVRSGSVWSNGG